MERKRLFAGILVPKTVSHSLFETVAGLSEHARIVPQKNYHVTLSFFGETEQHQREQIQGVLSGVAQSVQEFPLAFDRLMFAPPRGKKRMIWAAYRSSDSFLELVSFIEKHTSQFMTRKDMRNGHIPIPHVTLARFEKPLAQHALEERQATNHSISVHEIRLFESHLSPKGPSYISLETYRLTEA